MQLRAIASPSEENNMKPSTGILACLSLLLIAGNTRAQSEYGNDNPRVAANIGIPLGVALNPMGHYISGGWGVDAGAGYNINRRSAFIGEFMWNTLNPTGAVLQPVRVALQSRDITGYSNLVALTGNYRFEVRRRRFGTYFIGGGGLYHRSAYLYLTSLVPSGVTCDPSWVWWGYNCTPGTLITNRRQVGSSSSAFGANGGVGFTIRVGEAPYRLYVESRYHYAPTKNVNTQLVSITVGFRY
jgi:hypothetical protein